MYLDIIFVSYVQFQGDKNPMLKIQNSVPKAGESQKIHNIESMFWMKRLGMCSRPLIFKLWNDTQRNILINIQEDTLSLLRRNLKIRDELSVAKWNSEGTIFKNNAFWNKVSNKENERERKQQPRAYA